MTIDLTSADPATALVIQPGRLSRKVSTEVTRAIVRGDFPPGSTLPPERTLCDRFGVSRTVIREAIKLVEQNRLVRIRQGEGTTVLDRAEWNLLDAEVLRFALASDRTPALRDDVISMRADLEVTMLRRATGRLTDDDFAEMEEKLDFIESSDDLPALNEADLGFHSVIYRASENEIARTIVLLLLAETHELRDRGVTGPKDFIVANRAHRRVLQLLREEDADQAAEVLHHHICTEWIVDPRQRLRPDETEKSPSQDS
jgi:DNA-binding FadR family transcriptional regulator